MTQTIFSAIAIFLPLACYAADEGRPFDGRPGLWESTSKTEIAGMPAMPAMPQIPPEALAKMSPAQRAQVEAMMKNRAGGGPQETTVKFCMTPEAMHRGLNFTPKDKNCTQKLISSAPGRQEIQVECSSGKMKSTGDLVVERVDAEHAKGTMTVKAIQDEHPINMKTTFTAKWIAADCGDVKPVGEK